MTKHTIGRLIAAGRTLIGLTQSDLAERAGVSAATVSNAETAGVQKEGGTADRLLKALANEGAHILLGPNSAGVFQLSQANPEIGGIEPTGSQPFWHGGEGWPERDRECAEAASSFGRPFSRSELIGRWSQLFPKRPHSSMLPQDYTVESAHTVGADRTPKFLRRVRRGWYEFIGSEVEH